MDYFPPKKTPVSSVLKLHVLSYYMDYHSLIYFQPLPDNSVTTPPDSRCLYSQLHSQQGRHMHTHVCLPNTQGNFSFKNT